MAKRYIFDSDPDPGRLFDELYREGVRDFKGLELGDVAGHARRRFAASYGVARLVALLVQLDRLPAQAEISARGAKDQDKKVSGSEQAAHILPREIIAIAPTLPAPGVALHTLLRNPASQMWVRRNLYAPTDRVHRLVNVADSSCERGEDGMAAALVELCNWVLEDARRSRLIVSRFARAAPPPANIVYVRFREELVPAYRMVAGLRRFTLEQEMSEEERREMDRPQPVYADGRPLIARPTDTRLGSPDAEARMAAKITLRQVFKIYEETDPEQRQLHAIDDKIDALRFNEGVRL